MKVVGESEGARRDIAQLYREMLELTFGREVAVLGFNEGRTLRFTMEGRTVELPVADVYLLQVDQAKVLKQLGGGLRGALHRRVWWLWHLFWMWAHVSWWMLVYALGGVSWPAGQGRLLFELRSFVQRRLELEGLYVTPPKGGYPRGE